MPQKAAANTRRAAAEPILPLWTTEEVAAFLGVPVSTVYKWNYRHEGPPYKRVGKFARYRADDVLRWLAEQPGSA